MRAIWYEDQGPADEVLTLGETPEPSPGPGEVAVSVKVSGVNPSDVKQRSGARGSMAVARQIPHSDGAGVIKAVGEGGLQMAFGITLLVVGCLGVLNTIFFTRLKKALDKMAEDSNDPS